jgi:hypothetical protein
MKREGHSKGEDLSSQPALLEKQALQEEGFMEEKMRSDLGMLWQDLQMGLPGRQMQLGVRSLEP